ncbi:MAG TPA: AmmeMemoRadiSam system radical SAM enzyme [Candidatus Omnitrophota bacterium]|nr:AmmeMemoRadiSam system radical SAM enzyme [Candidatus Omnitrophota bacterium]HPS36922.1 AmmeMemoRadiSam system radical SAM enzyme [Candidatus Omnitrophota bacterium]
MAQDSKAKYWHKLTDGKIQCDLCPRLCKLAAGQSGYCTFRRSDGDELFALTFGLSSGFCVDPIEKKPLFHFLPGSAVLSFGTVGCNLGCRGCQNWDLSRCAIKDAELSKAPPDRIARSAQELGCASVAFTYNEPIIFHEYAVETAKECRARGIKTVAVTAGYVMPKPREEFYQYMDAANVDLKGFTEEFYKKYTDAELGPVLETLEYIKHKTSTWLEITTLVIPGMNDSDRDITNMTSWIAKNLGPEVPLHFSAFYPAHKMLDRPYTPPETLEKARKIALHHGLSHVYTGNIRSPKSQSTYCRFCGKMLIGRNGFAVTGWHLKEGGHCESCNAVCAGVFEAKPGMWGSKRQQVRLRPDRDFHPENLT